MQIKKLSGDLYEENTYVLSDEYGIVRAVIDPGCDVSKTQDIKNLSGIFLTHAHVDHIAFAYELSLISEAPVYLNIADKELYENDELCLWSLPKKRNPKQNTVYFKDGDTFKAGDIEISFIHTPGHTPGSVCYISDGAMFSGDTLMRGGVGRFDLPLGNMEQMRATCEKLSKMQENFLVYPGHGPVTSLRNEQKANPYLRGFV